MKRVWVLGLLGLVACGAERDADESAATLTEALTATQIRILGFEAPTTDWSSPQGVVAASTNRTQGNAALSIVPSAWTEIISTRIDSLGPIGSSVSYDLRIPAAVPWGETRLIFRIPSRGVFWQELGSRSLVGMQANSYQTITFPIPPTLEANLEATYTDLEIHAVINAPPTTSPYLIDNIRFAQHDTSTANFTYTVRFPQALTIGQMMISTTNRLQIDDRVTLGVQGQTTRFANFGTSGLEIGSTGFTNGNVYNAAGTTFLRSQATVRGFVRAAGSISTQPPVTVTGGLFPNTPTPSQTTSFTVAWPNTMPAGIFLPPDTPPPSDPPRPIAPGAYAELNVHSRSRVSLRAGNYFFNTFNSEPQAQIFVDTSAGPIVIYTRNLFRYHGQFVQQAGPEGQVLVAHRGTANVDLQVGFVGTVVAPNAQIDVRRPTVGQHRGAFFGSRVQVFSDGTVLHLPFGWGLPCLTPPPGLDDGNPCTVDACDLIRGVTHTPAPAGTFCSDGDTCNGAETCNGTVCQAGTSFPPPGTACTSNNACPTNGTKTCNTNRSCTCTSTGDDGNICTTSTLNPDGTFTHIPLPVGSFCTLSNTQCTGSATCNGQGFCQCTNGTPDDGNSCTLDQVGANGQTTHTALPQGTPCSPNYACATGATCNASGRCECRTPFPDDDNPCTDGSCSGLFQFCTQTPRAVGVPCSGANFCNGSCTQQATCECTTTPAPPGHPVRMGTFNTQFLANTPFDLAGTGHGAAGCDPDSFTGETDLNCLSNKLIPKIMESDYDFLALNEVFGDDARENLVDQLKDPYPNIIEEMDGAGLEFEQDSGLMLLSKFPMDGMTAGDLNCIPRHQDVTGRNIQDKAVGFITFDETRWPDSLAQKGMGFTRLVGPTGLRYSIFFTHLQASYADDQTWNEWMTDGVGVRREQLRQIVQFMNCIRDENAGTQHAAAAEFLLGDLNINGDISNPFFNPESQQQLGSDCVTMAGTCEQLEAQSEFNPDVDRCANMGNNLARLCRSEKSQQAKRKHSRGDWDFYFNNNGTPTSSHPLQNRVADLWAKAMTPQHCFPVNGAAPSCPVVSIGDDLGLGLTGRADYDRGFTWFDDLGEERLDYITMDPGGAGLGDQCAQHVTTAWNLLAENGLYEGGITPRFPFQLLGGAQTVSDHFGLNAEINDQAEFCNPTNSLLAPEVDPSMTPTGELIQSLPYRGAVHWIRIEKSGTYSFNVNPVLQIPPGGSFGDVDFDNGLTYRVYQATDLSRPILPLKGEVRTVPPVENCSGDSDSFVCWETPGFTEGRFHSPVAPFYVKVYHPSIDFPADWHGDYRFLYRLSLCTTQEEACALEPFEGLAVDPGDPNVATRERVFPPNSGPNQWYFFHVDAPDGQESQELTLTVTEADVNGTQSFTSIEILRAETLAPVLTIPAPSHLDAFGRVVWTVQDTAGLLDLDGNPDGLSQKYFVRINRNAAFDGVQTRYFVAWETPLTWLYGTELGGRSADLRCRDTTDALSSDEVYLQIVADGTRFPLGARRGAAKDGAQVDTSMDENDRLQWTTRVFPRLGNNSHGRSFFDQRAVKYVSSISLQFHEDDDTLTLGDDVSSANFSILGPVVGPSALPEHRLFGTDYRHLGGSRAHASPGKPCSDDDDCEAPLVCRGFFCRQAL